MTLALIGFGTITLAAGVGLVALAAADRWPIDTLRAIRTAALLLTAAVYVAAIWEHA
ncbi:hypothetical protein [Streptomyces sp.]|uniref:hypothetical protein n=1 Tax=Streptomyces sp. TaxID=1931 RepID=UPI002F92994E